MKTYLAYYQRPTILFEKDLLQRLIRIFNDEALDHMPGDAFGQIYEYFLNKFANEWSSGRWRVFHTSLTG